MTVVLAVAAAVLAACGTYLLTARTLSRVVLGAGLLGHAANIVIVLAGGEGGKPAFAGDDGPFGDPLPQAMVLTAIVITLGVTALLLAISYRSWQLDGDDPVEGFDPEHDPTDDDPTETDPADTYAADTELTHAEAADATSNRERAR